VNSKLHYFMLSEATVLVEQQNTASHGSMISISTEMTVELKAVLRHNSDIHLEGLKNIMTNRWTNGQSIGARSESGTSGIQSLKGRHLLGALTEEALYQIIHHNTAFGDVALDIW
jgi:hypothetical protein